MFYLKRLMFAVMIIASFINESAHAVKMYVHSKEALDQKNAQCFVGNTPLKVYRKRIRRFKTKHPNNPNIMRAFNAAVPTYVCRTRWQKFTNQVKKRVQRLQRSIQRVVQLVKNTVIQHPMTQEMRQLFIQCIIQNPIVQEMRRGMRLMIQHPMAEEINQLIQLVQLIHVHVQHPMAEGINQLIELIRLIQLAIQEDDEQIILQFIGLMQNN